MTLMMLVALAALAAACGEDKGETGTAGYAAPAEPVAVAPKQDAPVPAPAPTASAPAAPVRETGITRAAVMLMATPHGDAKPAGQLAANTTVDILERRGGWLRLAARGASGWARLHQVRIGAGPEARSAGDGLAILRNVGETGRSGSTGIVATTGIRGLSAEELTGARPDPEAVTAIERYRASAAQAREYARAARLKEASVPALPKPE